MFEARPIFQKQVLVFGIFVVLEIKKASHLVRTLYIVLNDYYLVVQLGKTSIDGVIAAGNEGRFIRAEV